MSKLTKDLRERIAKRAVNDSYQSKADELKKREAKLGIECYNHVFPKKVRDAISSVPEGWLRTCSCLRFNAGGWNVNLNVGKEMATPAASHCSMLGNIDGELAEKVQAYSQEKKTAEEAHRIAYHKLVGFLEQFTTFKKLEEAWPEGKKFYAEFNADRPNSGVPAVITKEINDMLGLKAKAA
jgi:hypothetical protein